MNRDDETVIVKRAAPRPSGEPIRPPADATAFDLARAERERAILDADPRTAAAQPRPSWLVTALWR